jgi:hypothetical protein
MRPTGRVIVTKLLISLPPVQNAEVASDTGMRECCVGRTVPLGSGKDGESHQSSASGCRSKIQKKTSIKDCRNTSRLNGRRICTIWALLHSDKRRGPSNMILKHILALPQLPPKARLKVNEYIQEKRLGLYGHSNLSIRRVRAQFKDGDHLAPKRSLATLAPSSAIRR